MLIKLLVEYLQKKHKNGTLLITFKALATSSQVRLGPIS